MDLLKKIHKGYIKEDTSQDDIVDIMKSDYHIVGKIAKLGDKLEDAVKNIQVSDANVLKKNIVSKPNNFGKTKKPTKAKKGKVE